MMRPTYKFIPILLLSLTAMMGTCSEEENGDGNGSEQKEVALEKELVGKAWKVLRMNTADSSEPRTPETDHLLRFPSDSTFVLSLKVNDCQGSFRIPEAGKVEFQRMGCTEICCDPPFSKELADRFSKVGTYSFQGKELVLKAPDATMSLELLSEEELERSGEE